MANPPHWRFLPRLGNRLSGVQLTNSGCCHTLCLNGGGGKALAPGFSTWGAREVSGSKGKAGGRGHRHLYPDISCPQGIWGGSVFSVHGMTAIGVLARFMLRLRIQGTNLANYLRAAVPSPRGPFAPALAA